MRIQLRLLPEDPQQKDLIDYINEMQAKGFGQTYVCRELLLLGLRAKREEEERDKKQ